MFILRRYLTLGGCRNIVKSPNNTPIAAPHRSDSIEIVKSVVSTVLDVLQCHVLVLLPHPEVPLQPVLMPWTWEDPRQIHGCGDLLKVTIPIFEGPCETSGCPKTCGAVNLNQSQIALHFWCRWNVPWCHLCHWCFNSGWGQVYPWCILGPRLLMSGFHLSTTPHDLAYKDGPYSMLMGFQYVSMGGTGSRFGLIISHWQGAHHCKDCYLLTFATPHTFSGG